MAIEYRLSHTAAEIDEKLIAIDEVKTALENDYYASADIDIKVEKINASLESKADLVEGKILASQIPDNILKEIPETLPNPQKLIFTGAASGEYDGSTEITIDIPTGESETKTVLSDNLFDKSTAIKGKVFYYGSTISLLDDQKSYYQYVPLRGAGTYRTKWNFGQHYNNRVGIVDANDNWCLNVEGISSTGEPNYSRDMEFVITQDMINSGAAKIAFDCHINMLDTVMIVKDREYPTGYIPYGYIEVATESGKKVTNILNEKVAVFLGDSICAGTTVEGEYYNYGWAGLIGEPNRMFWKNYGRNGAVITPIDGQTRIVTDQIDTALATFSSADYVIFEGGTNDADLLKSDTTKLGTIDYSKFSDFDTSTFTGAFEALILKIMTSYPSAKIGYIVAQKMGNPPYDSAKSARRQYFERAIEICEKWGIPYIDLWKSNPLNPKLDTTNRFYTDGQHLTLEGYNRIVPQIEAWMRTL